MVLEIQRRQQNYNIVIRSLVLLSRRKTVQFILFTISFLFVIFGALFSSYDQHINKIVYISDVVRQHHSVAVSIKRSDGEKFESKQSYRYRLKYPGNDLNHVTRTVDQLSTVTSTKEVDDKIDSNIQNVNIQTISNDDQISSENNSENSFEINSENSKENGSENNKEKVNERNNNGNALLMNAFTTATALDIKNKEVNTVISQNRAGENNMVTLEDEKYESIETTKRTEKFSEDLTNHRIYPKKQQMKAVTDGHAEDENQTEFNAEIMTATKFTTTAVPVSKLKLPVTTTKIPVVTTKIPVTKDRIKTTTLQNILNLKSEKTRNCKPAKSVVFLKTHKTGSSTIINIMQRHAHRNNLKIALPGVNHFLGWPNPFQEKFVFEHSLNKTYDIFCNHARFHKERISKIMSSNETKFVTIVRDPLYQFESTAVYLNFASLLKLNRSKNVLDAFFDKTEKEIYNRSLHRNTHNVFLLKNPILYDLGYPTWKQQDKVVDEMLVKVRQDFDLIMISDYMAESLVMLKNELCWDMKDILFFTMNKRPDKWRQNIKNPTVMRQKIRDWNRLDYELFENVNRTFWKDISRGGEKFKKDVQTLKALNSKLSEICLQSGRHLDKSQPWFPILGYKLKDEIKNTKYHQLCSDMTRSEIDFTNLLKLKQTIYNWTIPTSPPKKVKPSVILPVKTRTV